YFWVVITSAYTCTPVFLPGGLGVPSSNLGAPTIKQSGCFSLLARGSLRRDIVPRHIFVQLLTQGGPSRVEARTDRIVRRARRHAGRSPKRARSSRHLERRKRGRHLGETDPTSPSGGADRSGSAAQRGPHPQD